MSDKPLVIPDNLKDLSREAIIRMVSEADTEFAAIRDAVTAETVTDEQLARMGALREFAKSTAPAELVSRTARRDQFSALTVEDEEPAPTTEPTPTPTPDPEPVTASAKATIDSNDVVNVTIADITAKGNSDIAPVARHAYSSLVASAGLADYEAGQVLESMLDVAKVFEARSASHVSMAGRTGVGPISYPVAQLVRDYPDEFSVAGEPADYAKLLHVVDERRLPGGSLLASDQIARTELAKQGRDSLVASAGWCAPSETDYDICLQISTDGMLNVPEVQARRGGVRHNTGIEFDTIFGTCTAGPAASGFFNLSEAQVAAGTQKTCIEIPCPDFVDTRLGVTGLCLTGNILANRGYPEYTATFTRGALAASAHQINALQIAAVVAGSTAVTLTGTQPWTSDGSVVSQVMSAVEMAVVDIKYRLRAQQSSTLEVVFPYWVLAQMRADWIRRQHTSPQGGNELTLTDAEIRQGFAERGARVQFVYDWQDAFSTCAVSGALGADTPITQLPTSLDFLVYPAGTWVRAVQSVITLNSIYDSTKLVSNQVTQLFTEDGWAMLQMCPVSRVYTVPICPTGSAGANHTIVCA